MSLWRIFCYRSSYRIWCFAFGFMIGLFLTKYLFTNLNQQNFSTSLQRNLYDTNGGKEFDTVSGNGGYFRSIIDGKMWAFSAYYDARFQKHVLKIMGISHLQYVNTTLHCQIWYNETKPLIGRVTIDVYPRPPGSKKIKRYDTFLFTCTSLKRESSQPQ